MRTAILFAAISFALAQDPGAAQNATVAPANTWANAENTWAAASPTDSAPAQGPSASPNTWVQPEDTWTQQDAGNTWTQSAAAPAAPTDLAGATVPTDPWSGVGSASFYWHNKYHGQLAMSAYGNYRQECPQAFTYATLQRQYPGNQNQPFEVVDEWFNVGAYNQSGYAVRVPEMNKILMIFKGNYGWQEYNATLVPFLGIGCDSTCKVHAGALQAWQDVKAQTNDMAQIKATQQNLVWSAAGHGFGGMVAQVAALDLKIRTFAYSVQSFGAPPVFNPAAAAKFDETFPGDSSQRTVSNDDSVPAMLSIGTGPMNYTFVNTGIHVFGQSAMYGQDYEVCQGWNADPRCAGGETQADHYFYFTDIGTCGEGDYAETYDQGLNARVLASDSANFAATATAPLSSPVTAFSSIPVPSSTIQFVTDSANVTAAADAAAASASASKSQDSSAQSITIHSLFIASAALVMLASL